MWDGSLETQTQPSGLTWHWIATQRAQPAWAASLVTAVTRQRGRRRGRLCHPDTSRYRRLCLCLYLILTWSVIQVQAEYGSSMLWQPSLSVGISFVSINRRSPNSSILDLTRHSQTTRHPEPCSKYSWLHLGTRPWITMITLARPGQQEGGGRGREQTKKRVWILGSLWKSQICWSLNQEQDSTL